MNKMIIFVFDFVTLLRILVTFQTCYISNLLISIYFLFFVSLTTTTTSVFGQDKASVFLPD